MTQNYVMINGKRIDLSKETADNFKRTLGIVKPKPVKVHKFRATKQPKFNSYPYLIGAVKEAYLDDLTTYRHDEEAQADYYTEIELREIIAGLQELLES